jgi:hypothetical protein
MSAADIVLLISDIVAISVIAFVILSSPIRYFIRKRRFCLNVACCKKEETQVEEEVVRRVESVIKCAIFSQTLRAVHSHIFYFLRDIENNESSEILTSDVLAEVENDPKSESDLKSIELPVIDMPASPVFSRTGSQIIRRQSARFDSFTSDSFRRNSGSVQVFLTLLHISSPNHALLMMSLAHEVPS